jgi:electron transfer flavoprotein alpha subunit
MDSILTFIQHQNGKISRTSLEAIQGAQDLAETLHAKITGVVFGLEQIPDELANLQMSEILLVPGNELYTYSAENYTAAMNQILEAEQPDLFLAGHTYQARDWIPRLARRWKRPLISDCIGFHYSGELVWIRQIFQGKINADIQTTPGLVFVAFQPGAFRSNEMAAGSPQVRSIDIDLAEIQPRVRHGERFQEARDAVDLSRAERIISIGRGIGKEESLGMIKELAEALGAELGSSRPVVDYGWLPHERQIGSSGQTVSPKLYIAVGISGAIQHQVGMKNSNCIVAINKDQNAPIFDVADYGIVADLLEIVPRLTVALKERT